MKRTDSPVPSRFAGKLTAAQWRRLALHELSRSDREIVMGVLSDGLCAVEDKADLKDVLRIIRDLADDFREPFDDTGYSKAVVKAGGRLAREAIRDLRRHRG